MQRDIADDLILKGPANPDNPFSDETEPYFWIADNQAEYLVFWDEDATFTNFRLTFKIPSVVPDVTLTGQVLSADGAISSATLAAGTVPGADLSGQALVSDGAISRATLNVEVIPGIDFSGQALSQKERLAVRFSTWERLLV